MDEIHLTRENNDLPWGIRLTGGRDFGTPLTIIKISIGSIAEKAGLRVGDMLIKVNDQSLNVYTHLDAFNFIQNAGNDFKVSVIRGTPLEHIEKLEQIEKSEEVITMVEQDFQMNQELTNSIEKEVLNVLNESNEINENEDSKIINSVEVLSESEAIIETSLVLQETEEEYENKKLESESETNTNPNEMNDAASNHLLNNELNSENPAIIIENENEIDPEVEHLNKINLLKTEEMLAQDKNINSEKNNSEKIKFQRHDYSKSPIPIIDETLDDDTVDVEITAFISKGGAVKSLLIRNSPCPSPNPEQKGENSEVTLEKSSEPIITLEEALGNDPAALKEEENDQTHELKDLEEPIESVLFEETKKDEEEICENEKKECIENSEQYDGMTEDEIAEALLERAEVLKGKAIGVDFHKLPPDSDLIKESKVLQAILDEKLIKPQKKISAFLQLPKRPKIKPPKEIKPKGIPYLPLKYKGKKAEEEEEKEKEKQEQEQINTEEEIQPNEDNNENNEEKHNNLVDEVVQTEELEQEEEEEQEEIDPDDVDAQIGYIQKQLNFIMELPQIIQDNLKFLQDQLQKLSTFRAGVNHENEPEPEIDTTEEIANETNNNDQEETEEKALEENNETEQENNQEENLVNGENHLVEENNISEANEVASIPDDESVNSKKDIKWRREEEFVKNRPFFPLTPQPRPLVLPGGRKWWKPKDIYDEEFIAETLSGNGEILTGTTLGVNFNKFAKQYDYLKDSGVYQMIHGMDKDKRKTPFERRPSRIRAIQDYPKMENSEPIIQE